MSTQNVWLLGLRHCASFTLPDPASWPSWCLTCLYCGYMKQMHENRSGETGMNSVPSDPFRTGAWLETHIYKHPWILHPTVHTNMDWISNTMQYNKNKGKSHNIFQSFIVFNYKESQKQTSVRLRTGLPCSLLSAKCLVFSLTNNRHSINVCSIDQLTESF